MQWNWYQLNSRLDFCKVVQNDTGLVWSKVKSRVRRHWWENKVSCDMFQCIISRNLNRNISLALSYRHKTAETVKRTRDCICSRLWKTNGGMIKRSGCCIWLAISLRLLIGLKWRILLWCTTVSNIARD